MSLLVGLFFFGMRNLAFYDKTPSVKEFLNSLKKPISLEQSRTKNDLRVTLSLFQEKEGKAITLSQKELAKIGPQLGELGTSFITIGRKNLDKLAVFVGYEKVKQEGVKKCPKCVGQMKVGYLVNAIRWISGRGFLSFEAEGRVFAFKCAGCGYAELWGKKEENV